MKIIFFKSLYILFLFCYNKYIIIEERNLFELPKKNYKQINIHESNIINIDYIKSLKKVVYTALIGNYDSIRKIVKEDGYDYFMFTDNALDNVTTNWTILKIEDTLNYTNKIELTKKQRFYKILPHLFFQNYNLSIYIDTNFEIKGKLDYFLLRILTPNLSIYILEHPTISSINNEFEAVLYFKKELKSNVIKLKNRYKKENFTDNNGHAECCLIVRNHNNKNCIHFMEKWFNEVKKNSHRDQLSFNYIFWKIGNKHVKYISKKFIEEYFSQSLFHLKYFKLEDN